MQQKLKLSAAICLTAGLATVLSVVSLRVGEVAAQGGQDDAAAQALRQMRVGGSVSVQTDFVASARTFEPGNRTYWHSHAGGFILFVQEGKARVQTRGEAMRELEQGAVDYTPPGVEHWHGAAPDEPLLQLGIVPFGGGIEFMESVSDDQYNGTSG